MRCHWYFIQICDILSKSVFPSIWLCVNNPVYVRNVVNLTQFTVSFCYMQTYPFQLCFFVDWLVINNNDNNGISYTSSLKFAVIKYSMQLGFTRTREPFFMTTYSTRCTKYLPLWDLVLIHLRLWWLCAVCWECIMHWEFISFSHPNGSTLKWFRVPDARISYAWWRHQMETFSA